MRIFTPAERRSRLAHRHFLSRPGTSVPDVTADFVGLHATDPTTPYLSLWARLPGFTVADLDAQLYQQAQGGQTPRDAPHAVGRPH